MLHMRLLKPPTHLRMRMHHVQGAYYDPLALNFNPYALAREILHKVVLPLGVQVRQTIG